MRKFAVLVFLVLISCSQTFISETPQKPQRPIGRAYTLPQELPSWASPPRGIQFSPDSAEFGEQITINVKNFDYVYSSAYVLNLHARSWDQVILQGTQKDGWIKGDASALIIPAPNQLTEGDNFMLVYACKRKTIRWDCNGNKWMLAKFQIKKPYEKAEDFAPSVNCGVQGKIVALGVCDSENQPYYCNEDGEYVKNCLICGCPPCYTCKQDGTCELISGCQGPCGDTVCNKYQECVQGKCRLKTQYLRYGLVYVYHDGDTYNPNWESEISEIRAKFVNGLSKMTDGRISASLDVIGEVQTDIFCWNPSELGVRWNLPGIDEEVKYFPLPGSGFGLTHMQINPEMSIVSSSCKNCHYFTDEFSNYAYGIDCPSPLSSQNLFQTNKLEQLKENIEKVHSIDFDEYDRVFLLFGKLGGPKGASPDDVNFLEYYCKTNAGVVKGYYSGVHTILLAEESITPLKTYFIDCTNVRNYPRTYGFYEQPGWMAMVHEILHGFGAIDVYRTGFAYGITSYREEALAVDPRTDESIMGDNLRPYCMDEGGLVESTGPICTNQEIENIYLDKLNREKIGLN